MATSPSSRGGIRVGDWDLDLQSGELRKGTTATRLQEQPLQILQLLLEHPGEVVTREELRSRIWPADTFVDFDHGVYSAIKRLRDALGDSAEKPAYIQTLSRKGYRLIAPVSGKVGPAKSDAIPPPATSATVAPGIESRRKRGFLWAVLAAVAGLAVLLSALIILNPGGLREKWFGAHAASPITSLAVLPLENLSADPEQDYFAEGMTDELITDLAQLAELRVISRTSIMHYKGTQQKTLPQIARELNVDAIVEGTVARTADRVRIRVQLIRAQDDRHLWAQAYDRDLRNVLFLQSDAARDIAAQISSRLNPSRESRPARTRPIKPEAYEAYLKGRYFWEKRTPETREKAIAYFQQAIQQDPDSAPAYSGLADAYMDHAFDQGPREPTASWARAAASKALEIDPFSAEAHVSKAQVVEYYDRNWPEADREYRRGLELNPNYATGHQIYAVYLVSMGRFDQATTEARIAQHLDPVSPFMYISGGLVSYFARQDEHAIEQERKALEIDPNFMNAHLHLVIIYMNKKMDDRAVSELEHAVQPNGIKPATGAELEQAYKSSGFRGFCRKRLELDSRGIEVGLGNDGDRAEVYAALGEQTKALDLLEKAGKEQSTWLEFLNVDPAFDSLRSEPRFQALVREVGLAH
jgi:TolB-like protein/DNA-binding winged helix-turn-helix (wHTH) protein